MNAQLNDSASEPMQEIDAAAKSLAEARNVLAERLQKLRDEQEAIKRRLLRGLRNAVGEFRAAFDVLEELVRDNPTLFAKPKTRTLHGIRLGWMKQRGRIVIDDDGKVIELIRKLLPELFEQLVKSSESLNRAGLAELSAAQLKRLGVRVTNDTEKPFVKPADGELDKLIAALLNDKELEAMAP